MIITQPLDRARTIYREYPTQFWVVIGSSFIDRLGGALMFPFFSLYITRHFGVGMTEVGILFTLFSVTSMVGTTVGGALTDHIGRKGMIMSLNAAMVVLLQFPITRLIKKFPPMVMMAVGNLLYALGFGMYGVVNLYWLFIAAGVIITLGEMLTAPTGQALVARFAPEDMRGRYMALMGFSWMIPSALGPLGAGLLMDYADPRWIWYLSFFLGLAAAAGFARLGRSTWGLKE
ncbi:MAG: MFS transporter [Anaerolineales bacterium]|nr:MFS transporter [Anaerolineales bacterium]